MTGCHLVPPLDVEEGRTQPWKVEPKGRFEQHTITSQALRVNPLGDPDHHPLWVYLPPGVDADPSAGYPSIYVLQGLTGQVDMWWNRPALRPTVPERIDALFSGGDVPPAVLDLGAGAFAAELDAGGGPSSCSTAVTCRSSAAIRGRWHSWPSGSPRPDHGSPCAQRCTVGPVKVTVTWV